MNTYKQGAEAIILKTNFCGHPALTKRRFAKQYRHAVLDKELNQKRTRSEVRNITRCRSLGIRTPTIYHVDLINFEITMEHLTDARTVLDYLTANDTSADLPGVFAELGRTVATMHRNHIIHGDLTTSNFLLLPKSQLCAIDLGLSYNSTLAEDKAVDLYVLERAVSSTHPVLNETFLTNFYQSYRLNYQSDDSGQAAGNGVVAKKAKRPPLVEEVLRKLDEVRQRGRKRQMIG